MSPPATISQMQGNPKRLLTSRAGNKCLPNEPRSPCIARPWHLMALMGDLVRGERDSYGFFRSVVEALSRMREENYGPIEARKFCDCLREMACYSANLGLFFSLRGEKKRQEKKCLKIFRKGEKKRFFGCWGVEKKPRNPDFC